MDLAIKDFTERILGEINSTALPIEVKRLVIKDIYYQVERTAEKVIMQQLLERNEQLKIEAEKSANKSEEATE